MALKKLIYFTAGDVPTVDEKADIAQLNAVAVAPYEIAVRSSVRPMSSGGPYENCNYVSGTIPDVALYEGKPVVDPDAIPNQFLVPTQAIVSNGQTIVSGDTSYILTVVNNVVTAIDVNGGS